MAGGGIDLHQSPAAKAVHLSSQQKKAMTVSAHCTSRIIGQQDRMAGKGLWPLADTGIIAERPIGRAI